MYIVLLIYNLSAVVAKQAIKVNADNVRILSIYRIFTVQFQFICEDILIVFI